MLGPDFLLAATAFVCQLTAAELPRPEIYDHDFEISQEYDKFKNETALKLNLGNVRTDRSNALGLRVFQDFTGEGRETQRDLPGFQFVNRGLDGWRYLRFHPITFLADGERIEYETEHDGQVKDGYVIEFLWVHPTKSQLLKIVHAKDVQVRVGLDEFAFTKAHMNALKEFLSYVVGPTLPLSSPAMKKMLHEARSLESQGLDGDARNSYERIIKLGEGSREAIEAAKGLKRLDTPAQKEARKRAMAAKSKAESEAQKVEEAASKAEADKATVGRIRQKLNSTALT
jgi:hypothetical protein